MFCVSGSPDMSSSWTPPVAAPPSSYSGGSQKSSTGPSNKTGSTQLSGNISTPQNLPPPNSSKSPFNSAVTQPHSQPSTPSHIQPFAPNVRGPSASSAPNRQSPGSATQPPSQCSVPLHIQQGSGSGTSLHYQQNPMASQTNQHPSANSLIFHQSGRGQTSSITEPQPSTQTSEQIISSSPGPSVPYHVPILPAESLGGKQKTGPSQATPKSSGGQTVLNSFGKSVGNGASNSGPNGRQQGGSAQLIVRLPPPYNKNGSCNVETKISNI